MKHPKLASWDRKLRRLMDNLDDYLEDTFGSKYRLHPARATRGKTSSKAHDGLFNISAQFTLGRGSQFGRGYVVDVHLSTLERIPKEEVEKIERVTLDWLEKNLPKYFPNRDLHVKMDGHLIKMYGDLSLGNV